MQFDSIKSLVLLNLCVTLALTYAAHAERDQGEGEYTGLRGGYYYASPYVTQDGAFTNDPMTNGVANETSSEFFSRTYAAMKRKITEKIISEVQALYKKHELIPSREKFVRTFGSTKCFDFEGKRLLDGQNMDGMKVTCYPSGDKEFANWLKLHPKKAAIYTESKNADKKEKIKAEALLDIEKWEKCYETQSRTLWANKETPARVIVVNPDVEYGRVTENAFPRLDNADSEQVNRSKSFVYEVPAQDPCKSPSAIQQRAEDLKNHMTNIDGQKLGKDELEKLSDAITGLNAAEISFGVDGYEGCKKFPHTLVETATVEDNRTDLVSACALQGDTDCIDVLSDAHNIGAKVYSTHVEIPCHGTYKKIDSQLIDDKCIQKPKAGQRQQRELDKIVKDCGHEDSYYLREAPYLARKNLQAQYDSKLNQLPENYTYSVNANGSVAVTQLPPGCTRRSSDVDSRKHSVIYIYCKDNNSSSKMNDLKVRTEQMQNGGRGWIMGLGSCYGKYEFINM